MNRFLIVGCGGSGGATLQFLADQLRAELAGRGIWQLPRGWQFVHVDVPGRPDGVGHGMPPTVPAQGGRYVPMASAGATYPDISEAVELRLAERDILAELATWRPDPHEVTFPVQDGAGQYRAVGRMLTLAKAQQIRSELESAMSDLAAAGVEDELARVADVFSPSTRNQAGRPPRILVISSMAGGAGASMTLDVCRLLSTVRNVDPRQVLLMLYTAEVFGDLPENLRVGVEANAAAMIGELMATQTGAAADSDRRLLAAFGVDASEADRVPFRRVIPIGRNVGGDGAAFGDGTHTGVFRGIGRSVAALMLSGVATLQLQKATVENFGAGASVDRSTLGWGVDQDSLVWGAFGFASVGLGRDRYAEYAAQRIARQCADRLVNGHVQTGDPRLGGEQLSALLAGTIWPAFLARAGLPHDVDTTSVRTWLTRQLELRQYATVADGVVRDVLDRRLDPNAQHEVSAWLTIVDQSAREQRAELSRQVDEAAGRWAFDWAMGTHELLLEALREIVAGFGLPAARATLARLRDALPEWGRQMELGIARATQDVTAVPPDLRSRLARLKGRTGLQGGPLGELLDGHRRTVREVLAVRFTQTVVRLLAEFPAGVIDPLHGACGEALQHFTDGLTVKASGTGQALLRTTEYAAWPAGGRVPARFSEAQNEILLTSADGFEDEFLKHVRASMPKAASVDDAMAGIAGTVLDGRWSSTGADWTPPAMFEVLTEWWPAAFTHDPRQGEAARARAPRNGRYRVSLGLPAVLDRARGWVARRDEAFDQFVSQSLRTFLTSPGIGESERRAREREFVTAFVRALRLARPLVGVNPRTVELVHNEPLGYYHSFSGVPLSGLDPARELEQLLRDDQDELPQSRVAFAEALTAGEGSTATRVDIFATTQNLSPVVFTSLLEPVWRRWSSSGEAARGQFWRWRRTRRLPGAIPAGDAARRAMVAGWYLGRLLGLLRYPGEGNAAAVSVYDLEEREWLAFPQLLPTPIEGLTHAGDRMAAVLEAMPLALAACHASPRLEPLRPYRVLRRIWDTSRYEAAHVRGTGAEQLLGQWVRDGRTASGLLPAPSLAGSPEHPPEERQKLVVQTLQKLQESTEQFLAPGQRGSSGIGPWSVLRSPRTLASVPLFHELAPDAHDMLGELARLAGQVSLTSEPGAGLDIQVTF